MRKHSTSADRTKQTNYPAILSHPLKMAKVIGAHVKQSEKREVVTHVDQQTRRDGSSDHPRESQNQPHDEEHQERPPGLAKLFAVDHGKAAAGYQHGQKPAPPSGGRRPDSRRHHSNQSEQDGETTSAIVADWKT